MNKNFLLLATLGLAAATTAYAQNTYPWPASGNVGIGTTTPDGRLHITGAPNNWTTNGWCKGLRLDGIHAIEFGGGSGVRYGLGQSDNALYFFDTTAEDNSAGAAYRMVLRGGNLGIGTANPGDKLHVAGNIILGIPEEPEKSIQAHGQDFRISSGWNKTLTLGHEQFTPNGGRVIIPGGNVGIGTTDPSAGRLVVYDSGKPPVAWGLSSPLGYLSWGSANEAIVRSVNALKFQTSGGGVDAMWISTLGNVGIGTTSPTEKLSVKGKIRAQEIIVETTGWSDHVFAKDYTLAPLSEVEQHIEQQGHLPGVPSAKEVAVNGVSVGDMQAILLAKIEELTLHQIAQEKRFAVQDAKLEAQQAEIAILRTENAQFKAQTK